MPTLFRLLGYRFFYRMYDLLNEPCHVHVGDDAKKLCKYWIREDDSVTLVESAGFSRKKLNEIERVIVENMEHIKLSYESDCKANGLQPNYYRKGDN